MYTLYLPSDKNFFLIIKKQSFVGYRGMVEGGGGLRSVQEGMVSGPPFCKGGPKNFRSKYLGVTFKILKFWGRPKFKGGPEI